MCVFLLGSLPRIASAQAEPVEIEFASRRTISEGMGAYEGRQEAVIESGSLVARSEGARVLEGADAAMARHVTLTRRSREQADACTFREESGAFDVDLEAPVLRPEVTATLGEASSGEASSGEAVARPPFGGVLHVSTSIESDAIVPLRGHEYVATRGMVIDMSGVSVSTILLEASGRSEHPTEQGLLVGHWSDSFWFDDRTGWVLRREQTEIIEGESDGYEERELTWAVRAPFLDDAAENVQLEIHDCADPRPARSTPWLRVGLPASVVVALVVVVGAIRKRFAGEGT